jgi:hypothetical protein
LITFILMRKIAKYAISTAVYLSAAGTAFAQTATPSATPTTTTTLPDAGFSTPTLMLVVGSVILISLGAFAFSASRN